MKERTNIHRWWREAVQNRQDGIRPTPRRKPKYERVEQVISPSPWEKNWKQGEIEIYNRNKRG